MTHELPDELLATVFSYLDAKSLTCTSFVCTTWYNLCEEFNLFYQRIASAVPHLSALDPKVHEINLPKLCAALEKKYLIFGGTGDQDMCDIQQTISSKGLKVDIYNLFHEGYKEQFLLNTLSEYAALLVYNDHSCFEEYMGDIFADYLEGGFGGIVQCVFSASCSPPSGAYKEKHYCPIAYNNQHAFGHQVRFVPEDFDHFLLVGVESFLPSISGDHTPGGVISKIDKDLVNVVAKFDCDDTVAVVTRELRGVNKGRVCLLNFYPASTASEDETTQSSHGWDKNSNGGELLANALLYCAITTNITDVQRRKPRN